MNNINTDYIKQINQACDNALFETVAKHIQEEIDWEIQCDLMTQGGWHKVTADAEHRINDYDMKEWLDKNIKGHYKSRYNTWLFERSGDAMWFSLKWA